MSTKKKQVCIIPARGGSKGIPKKNLLSIGGKPLVDWSILCAKQSNLFEQIILTSDDPEILARAEILNITPLNRPDSISTDQATSESALQHALEHFNLKSNTLVSFLQPTSPLRSPKDLINAHLTFQTEQLDSLFSSSLIEDWFIWEKNKSNSLESVTYDWKTRKRRQDLQKRFLENGSFYIFNSEILFETTNRLGGKIGTQLMDSWKSLEIDSEENISTADILLKYKLLKEWDLQ